MEQKVLHTSSEECRVVCTYISNAVSNCCTQLAHGSRNRNFNSSDNKIVRWKRSWTTSIHFLSSLRRIVDDECAGHDGAVSVSVETVVSAQWYLGVYQIVVPTTALLQRLQSRFCGPSIPYTQWDIYIYIYIYIERERERDLSTRIPMISKTIHFLQIFEASLSCTLQTVREL
jgi:hypothetical protein